MDEEDRPERCCFDDWVGHWTREARRRPTAAKVTGALLSALEETGLRERSVLDLGCGIGDVAIGSLERGASAARGYDLSSKAIGEARALAAERGVQDRAAFEVGDAAEVALAPADVVVLNRVLCCYPHLDRLLSSSLGAARSVYAFTAPVARGPVGVLNRAFTRMANTWYRLRRERYGGFRTFVHDLDRVDAEVRAAGFRPVRRERRRLVWDLAVYERAA